MNKKTLCDEFMRLEGQPVRIETDDGGNHRGIVLNVYENACRIIDKCSRLHFIEYCHIVCVEEPRMELGRCERCPMRSDEDGDYDHDHDDDNGCGCCG